MGPLEIILIGIAVVVVLLIISNIHVVPQARAYVIERLGAYHTTWGTGLHFKLPFIDKIAKKINKMEQVLDGAPQPVITKDNVRMQIDTVVFYMITDPKLYSYGHATPMTAIENLTSTTLRNIIGDMELDETLTSRDIINAKMRAILDEATDPWGIKVSRVELKNIIPPKEIQDAMEKQMKAERERRESILRAEGEKNSAILLAEGRKQSQILDAEAEKQSRILRAEAEKQSQVLKAEGEAEAILKIQQATADGIKMINEANPGEGVVALKSLESLEKVANGQATKIIIPSEIQNVAGLVASVKGIAEEK
ncbi:MAG: SPFH/Band 7/PHB domain protein [Clostridia bacterium]|nr:SPFH/Band 7/PHB domain protein [Clostridia bacterium]